MSALLVSTSKQMPLIVNELARRELELPGADRRRGHQPQVWAAHPVPGGHRAALRSGRVLLQGRLRGAGSDGDADQPDQARAVPRAQTRTKPISETGQARPGQARRATTTAPATCSPRRTSRRRRSGAPKTIREMPLEIVLKYLEKQELYRLSWGAGNTHGDDWTKLEEEFEARLDRMTRGGAARAYAQAAGGLRLLPGQQRRRRSGRSTTPRRSSRRWTAKRCTAASRKDRDRPLPFPAPAVRRIPVHQRLLRARQTSGAGRYGRAANRDRRRGSQRTFRQAASRRQLQRSLFLSRAGGAGCRSDRQLRQPA